MTDVFISYKREERATARKLADALTAHGLAVWWDAEMPPGEKYRDYTLKILQSCRAAFVIWSPLSVKSSWVLDEAQRAMDRGVLIPVFLEPIGELPLGFGQLHTHDLIGWQGDASAPAFQPVLASARRLIGAAPQPSPSNAETEVTLWRGIQDSRNPADFEAYLAQYGDGVFTALARSRLDALKPNQKGSAPKAAKPQPFVSARPADPPTAASAPFTHKELGFIAAASVLAAFPLWLIANVAVRAERAFYADDMTGLFKLDRLHNLFFMVPLLVGLAWLWDRGAAMWAARGKWPNLPRYAMWALLGIWFLLSLRMLDNGGKETHFVLWLAATWVAALFARSATAWLWRRFGPQAS